MTQTELPQCLECAHRISIENWTCEAFPDGIPDKILSWQWDHINPYPGDHGIRFAPIEE